MKSIKEYIIDGLTASKETFEGLFDSEDDLIKGNPEGAIKNWYHEHDTTADMITLDPTPKPVPIDIKNGIIYPWGSVTLKIDDHVPSYIQFDPKTTLGNFNYGQVISDGVEINQKDVDRLIVMTCIKNANEIKNLKIDTYDYMSFSNVKHIKNVIINYHKKFIMSYHKSDRKAVELNFNGDIKNLLGIKVNSEAPVKLCIDDNYIGKKLNKDKEVTAHIIKNLRCNYVYTPYKKQWVFADGTIVNDESPNALIFKNTTKDLDKGIWVRI